MLNLSRTAKIALRCFIGFFAALNYAFPLDANEKNPATKFVAKQELPVHAGPHKKYYQTGTLERGVAVDVYVETGDGWAGIRPPEGSHDWLNAEHAYLLPGGKRAEIVGAETPAWIGTPLSVPKTFQWQIQLKPTQVVDVIGEATQAIGSDKKQLWYKILPPPGEFRWIRTEGIASAPPSSVAMQQKQESSEDESETQQASFSSQTNSDSSKGYNPVRPAVASQSKSLLKSKHRSGSSRLVNTEYSDGMGETGVAINGVSEEIQSDMISESEPEFMEYDPAYDEGVVFDEGVSEDCGCSSCGAACEGNVCNSCVNHQTDSFDQWDATEASGKVRFRPLTRLLGLIGLAVVEGERVEPLPGPVNYRSPYGQATGMRAMFGNAEPEPVYYADETFNVQSPRLTDRFDHLPRPMRRLRNATMGNWLGANESPLSSQSMASSKESSIGSASSMLGNQRFGDQNGLLSARLGNSIGDVDSSLARRDEGGFSSSMASSNVSSNLNASSNYNWNLREVVPVSSETVDLQFTTPEIQNSMLDLTRIVSQPTELWELAPLASKAQTWIDQSTDPIARGEARLLLERIESFEMLRRRSTSLSTSAAYLTNSTGSINGLGMSGGIGNVTSNGNFNPVNSSKGFNLAGFEKPVTGSNTSLTSSGGLNLQGNSNPIAGGSSNNLQAPDRNPDGTQASDASGWLVQVYSGIPGQPEFALTDDNGAVITYVQPTPGMNLRRYLKQPVGIYGVKGYLPNINAKQIIAERIVRLR